MRWIYLIAIKLLLVFLRKKVIESAVKELQEKDYWMIEWKAIKKGRKVSMLEFKFKRSAQGNLF